MCDSLKEGMLKLAKEKYNKGNEKILGVNKYFIILNAFMVSWILSCTSKSIELYTLNMFILMYASFLSIKLLI